MGNVSNITVDTFPKQSANLQASVSVCFHYDVLRAIDGVVVRDDVEEPFVMIIRLNDGRFVLSTECQYTYNR